MRKLGIGALLALSATLAAFLAAPASAVPVRSQFQISEFGPAMDSETDALDTTMAYNAAADEYLVVWAGGPEFGDFEIYGRRLDSDGDPIGGHFQISSQGSPDVVGEPDEAEPAVAYDPELNQYLVVWSGDHEDATPPLVDQEFEIFGQLIDADGDAVGADDFRISDMGTEADGNFDAEQPAVTYNSTSNEYLVVCSSDLDCLARLN